MVSGMSTEMGRVRYRVLDPPFLSRRGRVVGTAAERGHHCPSRRHRRSPGMVSSAPIWRRWAGPGTVPACTAPVRKMTWAHRVPLWSLEQGCQPHSGDPPYRKTSATCFVAKAVKTLFISMVDSVLPQKAADECALERRRRERSEWLLL